MASTNVLNQPTISAAGAQAALTAAVAKATELNAATSIAVVDAQGVLKAFLRMDGAPLIGVELAFRKAHTAIAMGGADTGQLGERLAQNPGLLARLAPLPGVALLPGGQPIRADGALVGAVGSSAPSPGADEAICAAAVTALA